jgi:hypothetical protein
MAKDTLEKKVLSLVVLCCALVLLACATIVRMPFNLVDILLGLVGLAYVFRKMRSRRQHTRHWPYTRR